MQFLAAETRTLIMHFSLAQQLSLFVLVLLVPRSNAYDECGDDDGRWICRHFHTEEFVCDISMVPQGSIYRWHYPMTEHIKKYILHGHNMHRNHMASGTCKDGQGRLFPPASRMRNVIWDTELEYIAYEHVARCNMFHSHCHSTRLFPWGGQNLAFLTWKLPLPIIHLVNTSIDGWWDEKQFTDALTQYKTNLVSTPQETFHFTQMAQDQVSRIACSLAFCTATAPNVYGYYLTCQYDVTNIIGTPVYHIPEGDAKPASDCAHWNTVPDETYPYLCKNTGAYFKVDNSNPYVKK